MAGLPVSPPQRQTEGGVFNGGLPPAQSPAQHNTNALASQRPPAQGPRQARCLRLTRVPQS
eukprot:6481714-Amphidinium_carterae.1